MKFTLPDQLPATVTELDELATDARAEINVYQARAAAGDEFSPEDVERLEYLNTSYATVKTARDEAATGEQSHTDRVNAALAGADAATAATVQAETADTETADAAEAAEVVAEAEAATADAATETEAVTAAAKAGVSFAGAVTGTDLPEDRPDEPARGWEFLPTAPKYAEFSGDSKIGAREIAESIMSVKSATGQQKSGVQSRGGKDFAVQPIARLERPRKEGPEITTGEQLLASVRRATSHIAGQGRVTAKALTAAGGWQAPSEQVYTFCNVPPAVNLISVPEPDQPFNRGGVRYPVESDMSALLTDFAFQFQFSETELEAVDGGGDPTAIKEWSELPPVTDFLEFRLGVIGYAIKTGILYQQGWPEAVAHDIERLMVRHQHGISWRTINDMVAGSGTPKVVPTASILGATSSVLNGLALQATNLRLDKGLDTNAPIEGVAPVWFREVIRADLALREGLDALAVTDAQISDLLVARDIYLQFVDDWQTRGAGQPGNMNTLTWPGFVDVMLYPAGTWFRALNPVIQFGVQYPMELLKFNQYSHAFFEDAIAVGKVCNKSIIVRAPLCVNGAVGARESITCSYVGAETLTKTVTIGGSVAPTGGSFPLSFSGLGGKTATIAWNSSNSAAKTALVGMDDNFAAADFTVTGGALPGTPLVITYPAELGTLTGAVTGLTGGTGTTVTVS